jgi:hypothetical protein
MATPSVELHWGKVLSLAFGDFAESGPTVSLSSRTTGLL